MSKLTNKQQRFCEEYVVDCNGTRAAIRAGYSENTAAVIGYENLIKPHVANYIHELQKTKQTQTNYDAKRILDMHQAVYDKALEIEQLSAAVSATKAITELLGIEPPKKIDVNYGGLPMFIVQGASSE